MTEKLKILALIYKKENSELKFLALRNNPIDPKHGGDFWYVVTGGVEKNENLIDAVYREIQEETGILQINKIIDLNTEYKYYNKNTNVLYKEYAYLVKVNKHVISLNEEHIDYEWLIADDFIKRIKWYGNDLLSFIQKATITN